MVHNHGHNMIQIILFQFNFAAGTILSHLCSRRERPLPCWLSQTGQKGGVIGQGEDPFICSRPWTSLIWPCLWMKQNTNTFPIPCCGIYKRRSPFQKVNIPLISSWWEMGKQDWIPLPIKEKAPWWEISNFWKDSGQATPAVGLAGCWGRRGWPNETSWRKCSQSSLNVKCPHFFAILWSTPNPTGPQPPDTWGDMQLLFPYWMRYLPLSNVLAQHSAPLLLFLLLSVSLF